MSGYIAGLYRHPVKGFTPEPLTAASLAVGEHFPCDRLYAVEDGPSGFDPDKPAHISKQKFTVLAKIAAIAQVRTRYDEADETFQVQAPGHDPLTARLTTDEGRAALAAWLTDFLGDEARGPLKVIRAPGPHRFMDSPNGYVSVVNLESVREFERRLGRPVDPLRFRANVYVEGWDAWSELNTAGAGLRLGGAELIVLDDTVRCAATHVDPATGLRDLDLVPALYADYDHRCCGVYAQVVSGGSIAVGDAAVRA